ncbi:hypothetical protein [Chitinophaga rhizophila]|uniref:YD repeat-containing protein n=1 Tax=Chitinophaga rhizophila TaxID=2866212 RepID=A0ABS7G6G8_9BACT|nr:hypothetical protein [Chitinophaga rhizophila]MBW8683246.1 hypothetical protein [Chitinophaga rhizophila]
MRKLLLSTAIFATLFTACNKEETLPGDKVFASMNAETGFYQKSLSYSYDKYKRVMTVQRMDVTNNVEKFYSEVIRFDTTGKASFTYVSTEQEHVGMKAKELEYDSYGRVSKLKLFSSYSGLIEGYDSVAYDNLDRVTALYHYKIDGVMAPYLLAKKDIYIRDSRGNVTVSYSIPVIRNVQSQDTTTVAYTYDDKSNYQGMTIANFIVNQSESASWSSANNVVTKTITNPAGDSILTVTNVYTYGTDNYPTALHQTEKWTINGNGRPAVTTSYQLKYTFLMD